MSLTNFNNNNESPLPNSSKELSELLNTKLRKGCKDPSPASLTCLRLDNDNSHIGVWQKRSGSRSTSNWVMRVELGSKKTQVTEEDGSSSLSSVSSLTSIPSPTVTATSSEPGNGTDEEDRIAMQMIDKRLSGMHKDILRMVTNSLTT